MKLYNSIFRFALALNKHGLKMPVMANTLFGPHFSFSQHFEQRKRSLLRFFVWHTVLDDLSLDCMFLYNRTMLSDKQSEHSFSPTIVFKSGLCNLKPCVTIVSMQKVIYSYTSAFATSYAF